jgi:hypothetical protein
MNKQAQETEERLAEVTNMQNYDKTGYRNLIEWLTEVDDDYTAWKALSPAGEWQDYVRQADRDILGDFREFDGTC